MTRDVVENNCKKLGYEKNFNADEAYCIQGNGRVDVAAAYAAVGDAQPPQPPSGDKYGASEWKGQYVITAPSQVKVSKLEGNFTKPSYILGERIVWVGKLSDAVTGVGLLNRKLVLQTMVAEGYTDASGNSTMSFEDTVVGARNLQVNFGGD